MVQVVVVLAGRAQSATCYVALDVALFIYASKLDVPLGDPQ